MKVDFGESMVMTAYSFNLNIYSFIYPKVDSILKLILKVGLDTQELVHPTLPTECV